jgi:ubiquinone/menaquinone biosynthesis C-methylase UbiE
MVLMIYKYKESLLNMKKDNQEVIWNNIAEEWNKFRTSPLQEVIEFLKIKSGKVLDLGCGSGRNLVENKEIIYYGIDFSEEMLKFAKKNAKAKNIKAFFLKEKVNKLSFEDNFFDSAIFISTLHCLPSPKARKNSLNELFRVMKKGSEALISVWDKKETGNLEQVKTKEGSVIWKKNGKEHARYYYFYEEDELASLLKKIGFKIIKTINKDTKTLIGSHARKNLLFYVKK